MPPKKKGKNEPKEPDDPLEYVNHIREEAGKRFVTTGRRNNVNLDIEQNVRREIRALLKINDEIFGRCMSMGGGKIESEFITFMRNSYDVVKVRPSGTSTEFYTEPERSNKEFDMKSLSELPDGLNNVFALKYQKEQPSLIDYKAFLESAVMLHDDILEPFLAKLKCHIESIHVCLGEVESWLLEPKSNIDFIEETFGEGLDIPTADDITVKQSACPAGTYPSIELCANCGLQFGMHRKPKHGSSHYRCPNSYPRTRFHCKKYVVLKEHNESGKFEKTFAIAEKSEQKKLKKFLEFMSSS